MRDTLVLCYHALSDDWRSALAVRPQVFEDQLRLLLSRGYEGATFSEALRSPPGRRTLAVTFDDAYRSVGKLAVPILEQLGLPATVFVPTAFADSEQPMSWPGIDEWLGGPHAHELVPMSWQELGALAERGWEIGSHTRTHPRLTELDDGALADELRASRSECEAALGRACVSIAYPYGDEDERVVAAARASGYEAGAALPSPLLHPPTALRWPRIGVNGGEPETVFKRKMSPLRRRLRATPAGRLLAARHRVRL